MDGADGDSGGVINSLGAPGRGSSLGVTGPETVPGEWCEPTPFRRLTAIPFPDLPPMMWFWQAALMLRSRNRWCCSLPSWGATGSLSFLNRNVEAGGSSWSGSAVRLPVNSNPGSGRASKPGSVAGCCRSWPMWSDEIMGRQERKCINQDSGEVAKS